jgi:hypothetical protein
MKNIYLWVLIAVSGLGILWWCQRSGLPVADVLPSQALVFADLEHAQKHIDQVVHSDFGKNLAAINLPEVLSRNNFSSRDVRDFQIWQKDLEIFGSDPLIKKFLSREVALALYRQKDKTQIFVALRLTPTTSLIQILGQIPRHWGNNISLRQQPYGGFVINHVLFKSQNMGLAYVCIRDLLIIAPESLGRLEDVIDVYRHKQDPLHRDPLFEEVRQNAYPSAEGLLFVNINQFSGLLRGEMDSRLTSLGYKTEAFPVYGLSYKPGVVSKYKMIVRLNEKFMPEGMRKTFACPALANDTLKLVPVTAIAYNWGGCYDLDQSWELIKKRLYKSPELAQEIRQFKLRLEKHFNINIKKDVLPLLGQQIGGYLTDVDTQGTYPFPRLLVFVKIEDRAKAQQLLDKFIEHPVTAIHNETYNQVDIHYISLTLGANMDPGYAFLGDYLLVATSRQLLRQSIDAYNNSLHSLVSDESVGQFNLDSGGKFHSMTLMKTAELSRRAQDLLGWVDKFLSGQVSVAAASKQDWTNKKHELDLAIADKSAELVLAQKKLTQLKKSTLSDVFLNDPSLVSGAIRNLSREEDTIREDIASYKEQKEDLSRLLENYALGAQSAKLTMYNMENLVSPVLKGLESIDAQAVTVRFGDKILETELLVK